MTVRILPMLTTAMILLIMMIQPVSSQSVADLDSVNYPETLFNTLYRWGITDFNESILAPHNMTIGAAIKINFNEAPAGHSSEELAIIGWTIEYYIPHEENSTAYFHLKNQLEIYAGELIYIEESPYQTRGEWFHDMSNTTRTAETYGYTIIEETDKVVKFEYETFEGSSVNYTFNKETGLLVEKLSNSYTLTNFNTDVSSERSDLLETHIDWLPLGGILQIVTSITVLVYFRKFRI